MSLYKSPRNELDPLDSEILERAFETTWDTIKGTDQHFDAESDEELEAALRRELIEIARLNGVSGSRDAEGPLVSQHAAATRAAKRLSRLSRASTTIVFSVSAWPSLLRLRRLYAVRGMTGRAVRQLMTNFEQIQAKARELGRSGKFHGWRPIAFELRFEEGYEEAREWLHDAATQDELDRLCQTAREAKNEAA